ncbi:MAG: transporter, partial [Betaproteobacteria bacterium]|nr:transporter [Betaproteobacteria bacterium]
SNALGVTADFNGFNQTIGSLAGGGASGGTILLGTNHMTLGTANANTSFGGLIDGSGSVIKVGTGTQTLTSANTYSGGTFLNAGGITIGHGRALGTGDLTFVSNNTVLGASASVTLTNRVALNANGIVDTAANSLTMSGVISGTGSLTKQGSGVLNLLGTNTYTGVNNLLGGTLALGNSQAISGNTVTVASNSTVLALANLNLSNAVTLNSGRIGSVDTGGFDVTWDGLFSGAGGLGKLGAGTLFLLKDNVYSGSTTISQGVVQLGNGGNSGDIGTGTVTNNAKLIINRGGTFTLTNLIVGTGSVEVNGTATVSMGALSAANTYSGGTVVNGGTVLADGPNNATLGTFGTGLLTINNGGRVFVTRDNSTRSTSGYMINAGGLLEISNGVTV